MKPKKKGPRPLFIGGVERYDRFDYQPPNALDPRAVAVFLAVYHGARTFRDIARRLNIAVSTAHEWGEKARLEGLIEFTSGQQGTLHCPLTIVKKGD